MPYDSLMELTTILKALVIWIIILVLAIINGGFRESVLIPKLGKRSGLLISGLMLSVFIIAVTYLLLPWLDIFQIRGLMMIGGGWLILTLVFEFSFGLIRGIPLDKILEAYNFKDGNMWPLVLLVTALAPLMAGWMRG